MQIQKFFKSVGEPQKDPHVSEDDGEQTIPEASANIHLSTFQSEINARQRSTLLVNLEVAGVQLRSLL